LSTSASIKIQDQYSSTSTEFEYSITEIFFCN